MSTVSAITPKGFPGFPGCGPRPKLMMRQAIVGSVRAERQAPTGVWESQRVRARFGPSAGPLSFRTVLVELLSSVSCFLSDSSQLSADGLGSHAAFGSLASVVRPVPPSRLRLLPHQRPPHLRRQRHASPCALRAACTTGAQRHCPLHGLHCFLAAFGGLGLGARPVWGAAIVRNLHPAHSRQRPARLRLHDTLVLLLFVLSAAQGQVALVVA